MNEETKHPNTTDIMTEQDKGRCAPALGSATRVPKPIQYGIKIVWGYSDAPKLPDTWKIKRCAMAAAVAIAPDGKEYIIGDGVLYPWLTCPTEGLPMSLLKPGQKYVDTHAAIKLPNAAGERPPTAPR